MRTPPSSGPVLAAPGSRSAAEPAASIFLRLITVPAPSLAIEHPIENGAVPAQGCTAARAPVNRRGSVFGGRGLQLDIILEAHVADHLELLLERVDMLLLILEDVREQVA